MGKVDDALSFLAVKRMNLAFYDKMTPEQQKSYMDKMKRDIDDELRAKALQECLMTRYRQYYNKLLDEGEDEELFPVVKELNEDRKKKDAETVKSEYSFIMINPHPQASLTEFKQTLDKAMKKTFIKKSLYVIEQRGESMEELGKGFHAHILINKGDHRFSHMSREFANTFKKLCDVSNPHCFNVSLCKPTDLYKRQNYMISRKSDATKWIKQDFDVIFRKERFLQPYYGELFDVDIGDVAAGL